MFELYSDLVSIIKPYLSLDWIIKRIQNKNKKWDILTTRITQIIRYYKYISNDELYLLKNIDQKYFHEILVVLFNSNKYLKMCNYILKNISNYFKTELDLMRLLVCDSYHSENLELFIKYFSKTVKWDGMINFAVKHENFELVDNYIKHSEYFKQPFLPKINITDLFMEKMCSFAYGDIIIDNYFQIMLEYISKDKFGLEISFDRDSETTIRRAICKLFRHKRDLSYKILKIPEISDAIYSININFKH